MNASALVLKLMQADSRVPGRHTAGSEAKGSRRLLRDLVRLQASIVVTGRMASASRYAGKIEGASCPPLKNWMALFELNRRFGHHAEF